MSDGQKHTFVFERHKRSHDGLPCAERAKTGCTPITNLPAPPRHSQSTTPQGGLTVAATVAAAALAPPPYPPTTPQRAWRSRSRPSPRGRGSHLRRSSPLLLLPPPRAVGAPQPHTAGAPLGFVGLIDSQRSRTEQRGLRIEARATDPHGQSPKSSARPPHARGLVASLRVPATAPDGTARTAVSPALRALGARRRVAKRARHGGRGRSHPR